MSLTITVTDVGGAVLGRQAVPDDDYFVIATGSCTYAVQAYANGTHVVTFKGRKDSAAKDDPTERLANLIHDERAPLVLDLDERLTADVAREYLTRRRDEANEELANAGAQMEYWHRDQRDRIEQLLALLPTRAEG